MTLHDIKENQDVFMKILGISAFYHDAAASLLEDGEIVAAAQEERFTRKKNDASFPLHAIRYCLDHAGCTLNDLDAIVFYEKPFLKFERLLETYYAYAPKGLASFLVSMPVWIREKLFLKKMIRDALKEIGKTDWKKVKLLFPEHHLSHAASAYYPSSFHKAAILTIDGVGEWTTTSIAQGEGNHITVLKELQFPHSLGLLYSAFTYYCGFEVNSGEYKLMGLAPYGNAGSEQVNRYTDIIKNKLVDIRDDGSFFLHQEYFAYATGLRMVNDRKWETLFGFPRRGAAEVLNQQHCDLARAIQQVTEEIVIKLAMEARRLTGADDLCIAGGVGLNGVAAGKLEALKLFRNIFVQPAAGDAGGALGAALAAYHIYFGQPVLIRDRDGMKGSYLGPEYGPLDIQATARKHKAIFEIIEHEDELVKKVAQLIADGNVVGWFQGRMEFGPRALGARSILADARTPEMQKKLNLAIKFREGFRPFAPVVPVEEVQEYFQQETPSPYMMFVQPIKASRQNPYPLNAPTWDMHTKLHFSRSDIPAVTHIDFTARLQTVDQETNQRLWKLLHAFKQITGYSVLINTSFNVKDEPIVNNPEEAYLCFMKTGMDYLIAGNTIFSKKPQP